MSGEWEVVIGLEIHVQLSTISKIFSGSSATFGAEPNTQASALDLALPGVLPVVNEAIYPKAIADIARGDIMLKGRRTHRLPA